MFGNGELLIVIACVVVCMMMEGSSRVRGGGITFWWGRLENWLETVTRLNGNGGSDTLIVIEIVREGLVVMLGLRIAVNRCWDSRGYTW